MESIFLAATHSNAYRKSGAYRSSGASTEAAFAEPLIRVCEPSRDVVEAQSCADHAPINEPCSGDSPRPTAFGERSPSSIEKALYRLKPDVIFEVRVERAAVRLGCIWLTY